MLAPAAVRVDSAGVFVRGGPPQPVLVFNRPLLRMTVVKQLRFPWPPARAQSRGRHLGIARRTTISSSRGRTRPEGHVQAARSRPRAGTPSATAPLLFGRDGFQSILDARFLGSSHRPRRERFRGGAPYQDFSVSPLPSRRRAGLAFRLRRSSCLHVCRGQRSGPVGIDSAGASPWRKSAHWAIADPLLEQLPI